MAKIFLSSRRQDSAGVAGRIYDRLRAHFGNDAVFMDIDSIPYGVDFQKHIDSAVGQCDVVLTVIGTNWAGEADDHRRIDDPNDFVRIEIESALKRDIPVIAILIDHTTMPIRSDLPTSLAGLTKRNATTNVDQGRDFHHHVDRLIRGIEFHFQNSSSAPAKPSRETTIPSAKPETSPSLPVKKLTNSLGMTLIHVEPGQFLMGTTKDHFDQLLRLFPDSKREYFDDEQPQHLVIITRPFFLAVHEVTQGQYAAVMGNNPSNFNLSDNLPVENVAWLDAVGFCNKLTEREKRTPFYRINGTEVTIAGGNGYRLPTEAEWEYAGRAKSATLYPFGDDASKLGEHAWYDGNAEDKTHPVGQKLPSCWGLYDMLGNVWEWCTDAYYQKYYASSPPVDPPGAAGASRRVTRGGCWNDYPWYCRPASRYGDSPECRYSNVGFRVAAFQE